MANDYENSPFNLDKFKRERESVLETYVGKRIRMIDMKDDPAPIENGCEGIVVHTGCGVISVDWDGGRTLGVVDGVDEYEILEDEKVAQILFTSESDEELKRELEGEN
jgi:hypothetical protein